VGAQDLADGVEAAALCPSRRSSPWILTTPHRVFSGARRTISATSSSCTGGRPGGLGWRHLAATRRRCQRKSVPGVTIRRACRHLGMTLASAARRARSVQDIRGLGFVRRSTATSWRSASISASLDDEDRGSSASRDSTVTSSTPDTAALIIPDSTPELADAALTALLIAAGRDRAWHQGWTDAPTAWQGRRATDQLASVFHRYQHRHDQELPLEP
jgi:hypothetical protein